MLGSQLGTYDLLRACKWVEGIHSSSTNVGVFCKFVLHIELDAHTCIFNKRKFGILSKELECTLYS